MPITFDLRQEPGAGKPHARICTRGGEQSSFSNRDAKGKHRVIAQSTISFLSSHFPSSTCAETSLAPTAWMLAPSSAGRVKVGRFCGHRPGLALMPIEHGGTLLRSGFSFLSSPYRGNIRPSAECIVLFAVGPRARRTMVFEGFGAAMSLTRSQMSREDSRGHRDPSRQGRHFTAKRASE